MLMSAGRLSLLFNGLFVGLLAVVHFLKSDLDPSWHFISEYAIGKHGWVMHAAFLSLAACNVATLVAIRTCLRTVWGRVGACLFVIGTIGLVLSAIFVTDPINTPPESQTTSGNLHNLGGTLGLLGFLGTLILSARLLRSEAWRASRTAVWTATGIVVLGFLVAFISIMVIVTEHQGVFGPDARVGWPNRIGILSGCVWLAIIAIQAIRLARQDVARASSSESHAGISQHDPSS